MITIETIKAFLPVDFNISQTDEKTLQIEILPAKNADR